MRLNTIVPAILMTMGLGMTGPHAFAADPVAPPAPSLTYQGRLVESNVPVTGTRTFRFTLLNSVDTELWTSPDTTVTVTDGLYAVIISGFPASAVATPGLKLRVTVGGKVMTPDVALVPSLQAITAFSVTPGAVGTDGLADGAVTTTKVADGAVTSAKVADQAVTSWKVKDEAVTTAKVADGAVTTVKVADGAMTTVKVADGAMTTVKVAEGAVTTAKVADQGITAAKLADGAVTTAKVVDGAITTPKVADGVITTPKVADGAITTSKIADGTITVAKLATDMCNVLVNTNTGTVLTWDSWTDGNDSLGVYPVMQVVDKFSVGAGIWNTGTNRMVIARRGVYSINIRAEIDPSTGTRVGSPDQFIGWLGQLVVFRTNGEHSMMATMSRQSKFGSTSPDGMPPTLGSDELSAGINLTLNVGDQLGLVFHARRAADWGFTPSTPMNIHSAMLNVALIRELSP